MKNRFRAIVITALVLLIFIVATTWAAQAPESLTIKGDGVSRELVFSRAELEAMQTAITQNIYSVTNNFPTNKIMYRKGVSLDYLMYRAGIKDTAQQLKFISSDGYARTFTCQELLNSDRYYFAVDGSVVEVPTIIAFSDSSKGFDSMTNMELALTMGQRVPGEQNNPWFVKYLSTIEVSITMPDRWPQVTFNKSAGPNGVTVKLQHSNFDTVKIYYTTDGTNPTVKSTVYNVSASYYQPELNQPIFVTDNTEIRAIAVGAGKSDSTVASTAVTFDGAVFSDLGDYPWARISIEDLSRRGIINGMGDGRFAPAEPLTRAQFAKMIILALGEPLNNTNPVPRFIDVPKSAWHYAYIEKAAAIGIIKGYPDGTFRPDQVLSRQEMLTIVVQAMGINVEAGDVSADLLVPFAGESRISDWARIYVAHAEYRGILEHGHLVMESNQGLLFDAQEQAARAEAAVTVYRMLQQL